MIKETPTISRRARFKTTAKNPLALKLKAKQAESLLKISQRWKHVENNT